MQLNMFTTEPQVDGRSTIRTAAFEAYSVLLEQVAKLLQENHYSAHELYELLIHSGHLRPTFFKDFQKFLRWAVREGYIDKNRLVSKTIKGKRIPNRFTKEQLLTYFRTVKDPRTAVASFIGFWSGLRIGDVVKLKVEDFDFDSETIKIVQSKRSKDRIAPFLREAKHVIEKWIAYSGATDYLFPSYDSKSMATLKTPHVSKRSITNGFNQVISEAKLQRVDERYDNTKGKRKKFTFHTFRHTFCTYHLENNVNPAIIARAAGHEKMDTTVGVYGHMAAPKMIKAFRRSIYKDTTVEHKELAKPRTKTTSSNDPLRDLADKYVKGEITDREFKKKQQLLKEAGFS